MKKRMLSLLLVLCMVLTIMPAAAVSAEDSTEPTLRVSTVEANHGDTVTVDIIIENNPGIAGIQFALSYDKSKLEYVGFSDKASESNGWTIGKIAVWFDLMSEGDNTANGVALKLKFKVLNPANGMTDIALTDVMAFNYNETSITFKTVAGGIKADEYTAVVTNPTCTEQGYTTYTCPCGKTYRDDYKDALGHDTELENEKNATCTEDGYTGDKVCKVCKETIEKGSVINALGHKYNDKGVCTVCGAKKPVAPVHTHTVVIDQAVAATCTKSGLTEGKHCSVCKAIIVAQQEIKALGHTPEEVAAVAATCTKTGLTAGSKCSVCGEVLTAQEVVPALGHDFKDGKCTRCGAADPDYVAPVVNPFKDVEKTSPYYDAIIWAVDKGVTTGKTADTFGINDGCTRAQIVTFLYRAAGSPAVKADTVNPFTDVSKDSVYYNAILWAVENGITKGTTETAFDPNAVCTRGQIVTFLFRASGDEKVATGTNFADVASGSYCADAVAWAVANKVANGFADGTFRPEATCTRGQAVTFIYRALAE